MKKIYRIFAAALIAGLSFVSCKNSFSLDVALENEVQNTIKNEKAYLSFAINDGAERKVTPEALTLKDFDSIELTQNNAALKTWKASATESAYDQMKADDSVIIDIGTYNFAITLKNADGDILHTGALENVEIKAGNNPLNFTTKPYMTGKGKLTINWFINNESEDPLAKIKEIKYTISTLAGDEVSSVEIQNPADNRATKTLDLDCGKYLVKSDISGHTWGGDYTRTVSELVEIQNKRETVYNCDGSNEISLYNVSYKIRKPTGSEESLALTPNEYEYAYKTSKQFPDISEIDGISKDWTFLGWKVFDIDNPDGKVITEFPETNSSKLEVTAVFADTITSADDFSSNENKVFYVAPTDDTLDEILIAIKSNYNCADYFIYLDLSQISRTTINDNFLEDIQSLRNVILPETITSIGKSAFFGCNSLTSITIPEGSVTKIGRNAFWLCTSLKEISIPDSVEEIEENPFEGCDILITISEKQESIFSDYLKEIFPEYKNYSFKLILDDTTTSIGAYYADYKNLQEIVIPASVTEIGDFAFENCSKLEKVTFLEGSKLESIGNKTFAKCESLKEITIPASVTSIGVEAFSLCTQLEKVIFENINNLKTIEDGAFAGCTNLVEFTIPDTVIRGSSIFAGCKSH